MGMNKSIPVYSRIQRFIIIHLRYFFALIDQIVGIIFEKCRSTNEEIGRTLLR